VNLGGGVHLGYCSNIHPGESWPEVRANLGRHLPAVRRHLNIDGRFGIGLRLSAHAAEQLAQAPALREFKAFLADGGLYVFTLNGFPYGTFHGQRVKEQVYLPDWREPERLRYTNQLAELMAALMDGAPEIDEGSVSTVPGAYKAALGDERDVPRMVDHLLRHVAHLVDLRARTGRVVTLALEPEPDCFLETVDEVVAFFDRQLRAPAALQALGTHSGLGRDAAEQALHDHLGICLDLCHAAVEFEDAAACLQRLRDARIRVTKMQISAGLRLPVLDVPALQALRGFDDPVYLHQVVERGPQGLRRFADLPHALASLGDAPAAAAAAREWRVHFHVPIFMERIAPFASTQGFIREMLALHRARPVSKHLEVETYTWDVLPEPLRAGGVDAAVARELAWVRGELAA
jgi:sugar phosphate isomerase/epimerase